MARKPKPAISEGDEVALKGRVTRVDDDGTYITVQLHGYEYPVTLKAERATKVAPEE